MMNRYIVDTEAEITEVRDALVLGITMKLGHVVYINKNESLPLDAMAERQLSAWERVWGAGVCFFAAYGFGHTLCHIIVWWLGR